MVLRRFPPLFLTPLLQSQSPSQPLTQNEGISILDFSLSDEFQSKIDVMVMSRNASTMPTQQRGPVRDRGPLLELFLRLNGRDYPPLWPAKRPLSGAWRTTSPWTDCDAQGASARAVPVSAVKPLALCAPGNALDAAQLASRVENALAKLPVEPATTPPPASTLAVCRGTDPPPWHAPKGCGVGT